MPCCPLVDCHTHTSFSDGVSTFEENVRAAAGAVYQDKGIILHFDQDFYLFWKIVPDST